MTPISRISVKTDAESPVNGPRYVGEHSVHCAALRAAGATVERPSGSNVGRMGARPDELVSVSRPDDAMAPTPLLRGWLHLVCFFLSIPAGALLIANAPVGRARVGVAIYALGLTALFAVSGTYHRRRWSPRWRARLKRLDHGTIFVMIAGTYTPLCLVVLGGLAGTLMLVSVWAGAITGVVLAAVGIAERRFVGGACYVALGWVAVAALPTLVRNLTAVQLALVVGGGILYTVGVFVLGSRRPNPFPRVFGYHEIWHVMVVAAAVCHFIAIQSVIGATG
jgi:hemolysin III